MMIERVKGQRLDIGRTVLEYLMNDLKSCGYRGCRTFDPNFPTYQNFSNCGRLYQHYGTDKVVSGFHAEPGRCEGRMPQTVCERLKENSDLLVISNVPGKIFSLSQDMNKSDNVLYTVEKKTIPKTPIMLVSDCQQADLFMATLVEGGRIFHDAGVNFSDHLSKTYKKNTEVVEVQTIAYYLGIASRYQQGAPIYSLYRDNLLDRAEEIIEGVIDFQVEYGIWDPKLGIQYKPAHSIEEDQWAKIYGIHLKVKTKAEKPTKPDYIWEYQLAIRNRQRVNFSSDITDRHLSFVGSYDGTRHINH